jgi:predicted AlkP superfamily pyrophosphatase or phosphodiesterase
MTAPKKRLMLAALLMAAALAAPAAAAPQRLLLLSVDGLDWRYLRDADALGLKIPNMRWLLAKSQVADGVTGVWPTITWPSHTTMITGDRPDQHGILGNAAGVPDPALSYWSAKKIRTPTLYQCAKQAGRTSAAVNWPVTVDAAIDWNLPEVYAERQGDSSDMETVDRFGTPGLVAEIGRAYPSFQQQWLDDRSRTLATLYLLTRKKPDLMLLHLAELDSESHEQGPFTVYAKALVERSDELIGDILKVLPKDYAVALVSDHGFERIDRIANLKVMAAADGVTGAMTVTGGLVTTADAKAADWLRAQSGKGDVGREVPHDELMKYAPQLADAAVAFEPASYVMFGNAASGAAHGTSQNKGGHGFWPARADYRSIFLLSGAGIKPGKSGGMEMTAMNEKLEKLLGLTCK